MGARFPHSGPRGFTLVELLVVLGVLALIVGLVPLAGSRMMDAMEYRAAVQGSHRMLQQARSLAVRQGEPVAVAVDLDLRVVRIESRPETVSIPEGVGVELTFAGEIGDARTGRFLFYPDGSSTGGELTLSRGSGRQTRLELDWLTGRLRVASETP